MTLPGDLPPWLDTGLAVSPGDEVTLLSEGRIVLSRELGLWSQPRFALWGRFGRDGILWNGTEDTTTQRADREGTLWLATLQGEWATRTGDLATPVEAYRGVGGALHVLAVRWRGAAREGLGAWAGAAPDAALVVAERERLAAPVPVPEGWDYLWFVGRSDVFRPERIDGRPAIAVDASNDVGILRREIDFGLDPDTELGWSWRIDELPSREPEDQLLHHDYLSIALEFENGRDLTWLWSASLDPEKHFACPIPTWQARETHLVARSGAAGLGRWQREARRVRADYAAAIGEPPDRIVAVWLIALSLFQHGRGRGCFADVVLRGGGRTLQVL